ncbi:MAG: hypothetical protein ACK4IS_01135 [Erythrobacter sp.]
MIRLAVFLLGGLLIALGVLWALQGLGILRWPPQSAMIAQREWALYGAVAMMIGAAVAWLGSRIGGPSA